MVTNRIRKYRTEQKLSQNELSDMLPKSPGKTILSLIENGHVLPTRDMLESICSALRCTPSDLYDTNDLMLMPTNGGDLPNGSKAVVVTVSNGFEEALKELGYASVEEWLNEAKRSLLKDLDIRRMNQRIVIS